MTALLTPPAVDIPALNSIKRVALMDENGLWRFVPESTLTKVPFALKLKVTPSVAQKILSERNPRNRKIERRQVAKYVDDMINGRWHFIGDCITFDRDGNLINGQHRLSAVAASGKAIEFMLMFGAEEESMVAIDEGRRRSNLDVALITGMSNVTKFDLSIAAYILEENGRKPTMSRTQIIEFYESHKEAINYVTQRLKTPGVQKAPLGAVCARAYYSCVSNPTTLARLDKFIELLQKDQVELAQNPVPLDDMAPVIMSNFVLRSKGKNTGPFRKDLYDKCKSAVWNFLREISVSRLYGIAEEKFPLPGE